MAKALVLSFFIFIFSDSVVGSVRVAFLVIYKWNGEPWVLEKDGRFSHIAIEVPGHGWLHAHPLRGVELISEQELQKFGKIKEILVSSKKKLLYSDIEKYIGRKYDSKFSWDSRDYYCSELVAKILRIKPQVMYFDPELWPNEYSALNGRKGISPDDIYGEIEKNKQPYCKFLFN